MLRNKARNEHRSADTLKRVSAITLGSFVLTILLGSQIRLLAQNNPQQEGRRDEYAPLNPPSPYERIDVSEITGGHFFHINGMNDQGHILIDVRGKDDFYNPRGLGEERAIVFDYQTKEVVNEVFYRFIPQYQSESTGFANYLANDDSFIIGIKNPTGVEILLDEAELHGGGWSQGSFDRMEAAELEESGIRFLYKQGRTTMLRTRGTINLNGSDRPLSAYQYFFPRELNSQGTITGYLAGDFFGHSYESYEIYSKHVYQNGIFTGVIRIGVPGSDNPSVLLNESGAWYYYYKDQETGCFMLHQHGLSLPFPCAPEGFHPLGKLTNKLQLLVGEGIFGRDEFFILSPDKTISVRSLLEAYFEPIEGEVEIEYHAQGLNDKGEIFVDFTLTQPDLDVEIRKGWAIVSEEYVREIPRLHTYERFDHPWIISNMVGDYIVLSWNKWTSIPEQNNHGVYDSSRFYLYLVNSSDLDGDHIPDSWEEQGFSVVTEGQNTGKIYVGDVTGRISNTKFLDLPRMGANRLRKDLFIHGAWMPGTKPNKKALDLIREMFEKAPVHNPACDEKDWDEGPCTGVHIHMDFGPDSIMDAVNNRTWGDLSQATEDALDGTLNVFVGRQQRTLSAFRTLLLSPERQVGAYGSNLFLLAYMAERVNATRRDPNTGAQTQSAVYGISEGIPGSSFAVAISHLRALTEENDYPSYMREAFSIAHELGHALGLRHGGLDAVNGKPNYLSIMNYRYYFSGLLKTTNNPEEPCDRRHFRRTLDYSRTTTIPLDEAYLLEPLGILTHPKVDYCATWQGFSNPPNQFGQLCGFGPVSTFNNIRALDFRCDGVTSQQNVVADIFDFDLWNPGVRQNEERISYIETADTSLCDPMGNSRDDGRLGERQQYRCIGNLSSFPDWDRIVYGGSQKAGGGNVLAEEILFEEQTIDSIENFSIESAIEYYGEDFIFPEARQPLAQFTFEPGSSENGLEISFNAELSEDPDGTIERYLWDFNADGEIDAETNEPTIEHRFDVGWFNVELDVVDNEGKRALQPASQWIRLPLFSPMAVDDSYQVQMNAHTKVSTPGVLKNDRRIPNNKHVMVELVDDCDHGTLRLRESGAWQYQPEEDFLGEDRFTYRIHGNTDQTSELATVTLNVVEQIEEVSDDMFWDAIDNPAQDDPSLMEPTDPNPMMDTDVEDSNDTSKKKKGCAISVPANDTSSGMSLLVFLALLLVMRTRKSKCVANVKGTIEERP